MPWMYRWIQDNPPKKNAICSIKYLKNLAKKNKCRALTDKTYFGLSYHVEKKNLSKQNVQNYVAKTERKKNQT